MFINAIEKLKDEMSKNKNNPYIHVVGEFLIQHLNGNPESFKKVLEEGKTIGKSLEEMRKAAEKKKVGNCAVLTDQEGFEIVLKYFGIEAGKAPVIVSTVKEVYVKPVLEEAVGIDFDVKLEDLL